MNDYTTNQWIITKYPAGAGGKFITALLFLFDQVEHWYGLQGHQEQFNFFKQRLEQKNTWINKELNHDWRLNFFSRSYERNNNLRCAEFNDLVELNASTHFKDSWHAGKTIVDHWHKPYMPEFWQAANSFTIIPDDVDLLKQLLLKKIIIVDPVNKIATCAVDDPGLATDSNKYYAETYNNKYKFEYVDIDLFLTEFLATKPWYHSWFSNPVTSTWGIKLSNLTDLSQVIKSIEPIEDHFNQKLPRDLIKLFHTCWMEHSFDN